MKGKIYAKLPSLFSEELPKSALQQYKDQLYDLYEDSLMDAQFSQKAFQMSLEKATELALQLKNRQLVRNEESACLFFETKRKPK